MKVLQINCVYKEGSTGKITQDIHEHLLRSGEQSVVICGRRAPKDDKTVYPVVSELRGKINHLCAKISGVLYGGCFLSTEKVKRIIIRENPDVVHLQCINGYFVNIYKLVNWLKKSGIPTVLTLHAEFMYTANCSHALDCDKWRVGCSDCSCFKKETGSIFKDNTALSFKKMYSAFDGFNDSLVVVSVSPWLMERAKSSLILRDKQHMCIYNGIDTSVFHIYSNDIKNKYCPNGEKIIFHATPYFTDEDNHFKGGAWLLRLAEQMKDKNVRFVIAGKACVKKTLPKNVLLLGKVTNQQELAKLYSAADVTLLLSKRETFSMVVAESLCCGTPVVGFKAGAPEQIAIEKYSDFYSQGDLEGIKNGVEKWLWSEQVNKEDISEMAIPIYSNERMVNDYISVYRKFC